MATLAGHYHPRLVYNSITLDFDQVAGTPFGGANVVLLTPEAVRGQNLSVAGYTETLWERTEVKVRLGFTGLPGATLASLYTYWSTWGSKGKQGVLTLDHGSSCAGQWEYDTFNTFFTKAECVDPTFPPARTVPGRQLFVLALTFRQGQ